MSSQDELLDDDLIARKLRRLAGWTLHDNTTIMRGYEFSDFDRAMAFVNQVARMAGASRHYPDIDIRSNRVVLSLTTPAAGGLTQRDFDLARECEKAARDL